MFGPIILITLVLGFLGLGYCLLKTYASIRVSPSFQ